MGLLAQTSDEKWKSALAAADSATENDQNPTPKLRDALAIAEGFGNSDVRLLETLTKLADSCSDDYDDDCQEDEDKRLLRRALALRAGIAPKDARYMGALIELARVAGNLREYRDALVVYGEVRDLQEKAYGPTDARVSKTYAALAWIYSWQKDHAQARRTIDHALELQAQVKNQKSEVYADLLHTSAELFAAQDEKQKAEQELERAADTYRKIWGARDPKRAEALRSLVWTASGDLRETLRQEIASIWKAAKSQRSVEYNSALCDLGWFYSREKRFPEAVRTFEGAIRIREAANLLDEPLTQALEGLANTRRVMGLHKEAALLYERSFNIHQQSKLPPAALPTTWALVVQEYAAAGELVVAESKFQAMVDYVRLHEPYSLILAAESLGEAYAKFGDPTRAVEKFEVAAGTFEATASADNPAISQKLVRLARAYQEAGRYEDANRVNQRIVQISLGQIGQAARGSDRTGALLRMVAMITSGIGLSAVLLGSLGYFFLSRRLRRQLDKLYEPPAAAIASESAVLEPVPPETQNQEPAAEGTAVAVLVAPPSPPSELRVQSIEYHGDGGDLFAMRVVNLLFSLLTLGVYSFWGKAKVRRYLCGQAEFDGDRFAFHGNGRELLLGWLKGAPILAIIIFLPSILPFFWQKIESIVVAQFIAVAAFLLLWPVARAGAYRYRVNRMSWRRIRFSFSGRTLRYFATSVSGYILSVLTFGVYVPVLFIKQRRLLFNRTSFGTESFRFGGRSRDLLLIWICALPVLFATFGLFWPWWSALRYRYVWAKTTIAGARFRCTITGWNLARLWLGNALLIICTIGVGWSWASIRTLRFWCRNLELVGDVDPAAIQSRVIASSAVGESFADFLGFDFGF